MGPQGGLKTSPPGSGGHGFQIKTRGLLYLTFFNLITFTGCWSNHPLVGYLQWDNGPVITGRGGRWLGLLTEGSQAEKREEIRWVFSRSTSCLRPFGGCWLSWHTPGFELKHLAFVIWSNTYFLSQYFVWFSFFFSSLPPKKKHIFFTNTGHLTTSSQMTSLYLYTNVTQLV